MIRNELKFFQENCDLPSNDESLEEMGDDFLERLESELINLESNMLPLTDEEALIIIDFLKGSMFQLWNCAFWAIASAPSYPFDDALTLRSSLGKEGLTEVRKDAITAGARVTRSQAFPLDVVPSENPVAFVEKIDDDSVLGKEEVEFLLLLGYLYEALLDNQKYRELVSKNVKRIGFITKTEFSPQVDGEMFDVLNNLGLI